MPIRHGGIFASRAPTCPRDHFCRSTIAPRPSRPTTWNVFLPISIPITVVTLISFSAMGVLLSIECLCQPIADSAGARPDHPITGLAGTNDFVTRAIQPECRNPEVRPSARIQEPTRAEAEHDL